VEIGVRPHLPMTLNPYARPAEMQRHARGA
jgi:hypothetical protein